MRSSFSISLLLLFVFSSEVSAQAPVVTFSPSQRPVEEITVEYGALSTAFITGYSLSNGQNTTACTNQGYNNAACFDLYLTLPPDPTVDCSMDMCLNIYAAGNGKRSVHDGATCDVLASLKGNETVDFTICAVPESTVHLVLCKQGAENNGGFTASAINCCVPSAVCPTDATVACDDPGGSSSIDWSGAGPSDYTLYTSLGGSLSFADSANPSCASCDPTAGCWDISSVDSGPLDFCSGNTITRNFAISLIPEVNYVQLSPGVYGPWSASCTQAVTAQVDVTAPSLTCPATINIDDCDLTAIDGTTSGFVMSTTSVPISESDFVASGGMISEACVLSSFTYSDAIVMESRCYNEITRTFVATDECGNSSSCTQTIIVEDVSAPVLGPLADLTFSGAAGCDLVCNPLPPPSSVDACGDDVTVSLLSKSIGPPHCNNGVQDADETGIDCGGVDCVSCCNDMTIELNILDLGEVTGITFGGVSYPLPTANGAYSATMCVPVGDQLLVIGEVTQGANSACGWDTGTVTGPGVSYPITKMPSSTCKQDYTTTLTVPPPTADPNVMTFLSWEAVDICGNSVVVDQILVWDFTTLPSMVCPPDMSLCTDAGSCTYAAGSATDANAQLSCMPDWVLTYDVTGATTVSGAGQMSSNGVVLNVGVNNISYTYTNSGIPAPNTVSCSYVITVTDCEPPSIGSCPMDLVVECDGLGNTGALSAWLSGFTATDNCVNVTTSSSQVQVFGGCGGSGQFLYEFVATDDAGNTSVCLSSFTITDSQSPSILGCPMGPVVFNCASGDLSADIDTWLTSTMNDISTMSTDVCSSSFTVSNNYLGILPMTSCPGSPNLSTVIFTLTDECGNTDMCSVDFYVEDQTGPSLPSCATSEVFDCGANLDQRILDWANTQTFVLGLGSSDDCSLPSDMTVSHNYTLGNAPSYDCVAGTSTSTDVIFTLLDDCGRTDMCTVSVMVQDTVAPEIMACPAVTIDIGSLGSCEISNADLLTAILAGGFMAADSCDASAMTSIEEAGPFSGGACVGGMDPSTMVTMRVTDNCGNSTTCTVEVTLEDNTVPSFTAPASVDLALDIDCMYDATPSAMGVVGDVTDEMDACTPMEATFADVFTAGSCPGTGVITRTWSLVDGCGNAAADQIQTITITDTSFPTFSGSPMDMMINCYESIPGSQGITASDNCTDPLMVMYVQTGDCNTITNTWTATDCSGNTSTMTQVITLEITDPSACDASMACSVITAAGSALANLDCDGGGDDNATECAAGTNPYDPCDDPNLTGADICADLEAAFTGGDVTTSVYYGLDCDGGGINNEIECLGPDLMPGTGDELGTNPLDASDDDPCTMTGLTGADICASIEAAYLAGDVTMSLYYGLDCDGGGVNNEIECLGPDLIPGTGDEPGDDPLNPCDDDGLTAAYICANLDIFGSLDCDGGGADNATECANGDDPTNDNDDYDCASAAAAGLDICAYLLTNPDADLATLDCDGGGVDNATECANGDDPTNDNDDYDCASAAAAGLDICAYLLTNPDANLATLDCDGGGVDNATECANGDDPTNDNDDYDCASAAAAGLDICAYLLTNPDANLATLDCDGGGVDNATECANGDDPTNDNDDYDCASAAAAGLDICAYLLTNPDANLATLDCDGGGVDNATECANGDDPTNDNDDYDCASAAAVGLDICAYLLTNPDANLATLDCDGGGADNATECSNGDDPTNDNDDYDCASAAAAGLDICAYLLTNPDANLATLDCDGGGVDNATECANGDDPTNDNDDYDCASAAAAGLDICAYLLTNPDADLATLDCDGGGVDNATECANGDDPTNDNDDYDCASAAAVGLDICAYLLANPDANLATLDCDGGGVDNATECANGDDPTNDNDDYDCASAAAAGLDICAYLLTNPDANLATLDCDGGGVDNATECANGDDPTNDNDDYDCASAAAVGLDICAYLLTNPDANLATLDCDGGGADNATECSNGDDPTNDNDDYDCASAAAAGLDICAYLLTNPDANLATLDCDGGGADNATECANGDDPTNDNDDYDCASAAAAGLDICAYLLTNPDANLATLDCDGGGVDNATECANGDDPTNDNDDYDCASAAAAGLDICAYLLTNPDADLATLDCDGGGVDNATECANGDDPTNDNDDYDCASAAAAGLDICAYLLTNPDANLATLDCDGGGADNATECANGDDPTNDNDDYDCASAAAAGLDICAYLLTNPDANLATLDCDGGGVDNATECANGDDPTNDNDDYDCASAAAVGLDICAYLLTNPDANLATLDCDGGGVDNATECANGDDPTNDNDDYDCASAAAAGLDICAYLLTNPDANLATLDCDGGGVDNATECANGDDPTNDNDDYDCASALAAGLDICAYLLTNPDANLATLDCDSGGVDNATECANGDDPTNDNDDYDCASAAAEGLDICAYIASNPDSNLATLDCDGGGVDNITECFGPGGGIVDPVTGELTPDAGYTPTNPGNDNDDYNCENALAEGLDICAYLSSNPDSNLATLDCDGGGVDNITECFGPGGGIVDPVTGELTPDPGYTPTNPGNDNDDYNCENALAEGLDICAYLTSNPDSNLATLDCDGGGVDNITECFGPGGGIVDPVTGELTPDTGYTPTNPGDDNDDYNCENALAEGLDICAYLASNPDSNLATLDCDGGGVDNITECFGPGGGVVDPVTGELTPDAGYTPTNPGNGNDDYNCENALAEGLDICAYLASNPDSNLATLDCDGGGVDNITECFGPGGGIVDPVTGELTPDSGYTPTNPGNDNDDYNCENAFAAGLDICAYLASNPDSNLGTLDCDGGGVDNITECFGPGGGVVDPVTGELTPDVGYTPTNPGNDNDDYNCENALAEGLDICAYLASNPDSNLATLDCDGGGVDNITECFGPGGGVVDPVTGELTPDAGYTPTNPGNDNDDYNCENALAEGIDICAYLASNPDSNLATLDCDGGGVDNITECFGPGGGIVDPVTGELTPDVGYTPTNPGNDNDDYNCENALAEGLDICAYLASNPDSNLATLDCDGGGVDNITECFGPGGGIVDPVTGELTPDAGYTPSNPGNDNDDYNCENALAEGLDICAYLASNPDSNLATLDCDGGGVDNITECFGPGGGVVDPVTGELTPDLGYTPTNPGNDNDDYNCENALAEGLDICAYLASNPDSNLATLDCDGGGVDNITECFGPGGGLVDPVTGELTPGAGYTPTNPGNDNDDYNCENALAEGLDICAYLASNPDSNLATLDCDGGEVDNITECFGPGGGVVDPVTGELTPDVGYTPTNPGNDNDDYNCENALAEGLDICAYLASNPDSNLATLDCDGGGVDNITECFGPGGGIIDPVTGELTPDAGYTPTNPGNDNDDYNCENALAEGLDICAYLASNPDSNLATLDCDGGEVDNITECFGPGGGVVDPVTGELTPDVGYTPTNPGNDNDDYNCENALAEGLDICAYLASNPDSNLATLDCDGGEVDNITECFGPGGGVVDPVTGELIPDTGYTPTNPGNDNDDYNCENALAEGLDICAYIASNPDSNIATLDCDGGRVDNITECFGPGGGVVDPVTGELTPDAGYTPTNPGNDNDDYNCENALAEGLDICAYLLTNPDSNLATLDCDGGGENNQDECAIGGNPLLAADDSCDSFILSGLDLCTYLSENPNSPLATLDCDGGGVDNTTECANGSDPINDNDDYDCASAAAAGLDICSYLLTNPDSNLATLDCDGGGVDNATECDPDGDPTTNDGTNPLDDNDDYDCASAAASGLDICAYLLTNPDANLATIDCDGGGVNNADECAIGGNPLLAADDNCDSFILSGLDLCTYLSENPNSPLATLDCDQGGVNNITECFGPLGGYINPLTGLNLPDPGHIQQNPFDLLDDIPAKLGDFVWQDCDGDGQQGEDEPGLPAIEVRLFRHQGDLIATTFTDANGYYLFENLLQGEYYLEFVAPSDYLFTEANTGSNLSIDSDVNQLNGPGTTSVFRLSPGECNLDVGDAGMHKCVSIGELVWFDTNENNVWDAQENGVNGLKVNLFKQNSEGDFNLYDFTFTGHKPGTPSDDGYFKFCAPPGTYYLEFAQPPYGMVAALANQGQFEQIDSDITNSNGSGTTDLFTVSCGEEKCDIGAGYYPMGTIGDYVWLDDNQNGVRDPSENGLANVLVEAYDATGNMLGSDNTDHNGNYFIEYLQAKDVYLKFNVPSSYSATTPNMTMDEMDSDITNANGPLTTNYYNIIPGEHIPNVDAGLVLGVVPVDWLSFKGENKGNFNQLDWEVTSQIDVSHYEVQRSIDDASSFESIGKILSVGDPSDQVNYGYQDYDISRLGDYYYRIKQVDLNGNLSYTDVIVIKIVSDYNKRSILNIYPNPMVDDFALELKTFSDGLKMEYMIHDASGRLIENVTVLAENLIPGKHIFLMNTKNLTPGIYNIKVNTGLEIINKKMIVVSN